MAIVVHQGSEAAGLPGFLELPSRVSANDLNAPPIDTAKQAAHIKRLGESGTQRLFVAERNGTTVARLLARSSPLHSDELQRPTGLIGYFESLEDAEAVTLLFAAAERFLRDAGCSRVIGPMDGDTWHRYRLNVGPFDDQPFLLEPWNPPYYEKLWVANGFTELESYNSKQIDDIEPLLPKLREKYEKAVAAGYRFRPMNLSDFRSELERVYAISMAIFRDNFMYSPIGRNEFIAMYDGAERLLEKDSSWMCVAPDGSDAGFMFAYPDRFEAMQRIRRGGIINKLMGLLLWNRVSAVNHKTLGVLPEHRRSGTGGALLYRAYDAGAKRGWHIAKHCLMREDNPSQKMDSGEGRVFRRYVLYEKGLA